MGGSALRGSFGDDSAAAKLLDSLVVVGSDLDQMIEGKWRPAKGSIGHQFVLDMLKYEGRDLGAVPRADFERVTDWMRQFAAVEAKVQGLDFTTLITAVNDLDRIDSTADLRAVTVAARRWAEFCEARWDD